MHFLNDPIALLKFVVFLIAAFFIYFPILVLVHRFVEIVQMRVWSDPIARSSFYIFMLASFLSYRTALPIYLFREAISNAFFQ